MPSSSPGSRALDAWLAAAAAGRGHPEACAAAARAAVLAAGSDPWQALAAATPLARAERVLAPHDLGLSAALGVIAVDHPRAVARVPAGAPFPRLAPSRRKAMGAFDTPAAMAQRAAALGLAAVAGPVRRGLDPACGTGAFLLAMREAGVPEIRGEDLDPAALAVAGVVVPEARLSLRDGLAPGEPADLVLGNPPFIAPERQDKAARQALRERLPWLHGRFDLAVPFAWCCAERLRRGGGLCLVLPASLLSQPYGLELRRRWLTTHRFHAVGDREPFPGARVDVVLLALCAGVGPAALPPHGLPVEEVLAMPTAPIGTLQRPGDAGLIAAVRAASVTLGALFEVDTGVVVHGAGHRRDDLVHDTPAPGLLPYADARDLRVGRRRWLDYQPARMHRPKRPELFAGPKLLVPRVVGARPLEVFLDEGGLWVGHTVNVLRPTDHRVPLARLRELLLHPATRAVLRLERGERLDVYPHDLASLPVPRAWLSDPLVELPEAWGLHEAGWARLVALGGPHSQ